MTGKNTFLKQACLKTTVTAAFLLKFKWKADHAEKAVSN